MESGQRKPVRFSMNFLLINVSLAQVFVAQTVSKSTGPMPLGEYAYGIRHDSPPHQQGGAPASCGPN